MTGSVYSALAHRLATFPGEVYPLHVGDTWMEPAEGCWMEDLRVAKDPGMHRYSPPNGLPELKRRLADRITSRMGIATAPQEVLVAAGATGALYAAIGAIVSPGDEVLVLAPYWPLIGGMVRCCHGRAVPVPFEQVDGPEAALEAVSAAATDRTVALYVSSPNNPTGRLVPRAVLEALVEWARARDLWILADEVYEDYVFRGEHAYVRPLAPERTLSSHSFSKTFGMAGNRVGYLVGPGPLIEEVCKVSTHTFYCAPRAGQLAALRALEVGQAWLDRARAGYAEVGQKAAARLGIEAPDGSTFLFLDVADHLDERGLMGFLDRCADRGLFLAPGTSFGPYPTHVRLCFTSAPPDVVLRGVEVLAGLIGR